MDGAYDVLHNVSFVFYNVNCRGLDFKISVEGSWYVAIFIIIIILTVTSILSS